MPDSFQSNDKHFFYSVDADDRIIDVSENWNCFAEENGAAKASQFPAVLNQSIWKYLGGSEVHHLYGILMDKVRRSQVSAVVDISCDSPISKRTIQISINPMESNFLQFHCEILSINARSPLDLLEQTVRRSADILRICSFCKKIDIGDQGWADTEDAIHQLGLFNRQKLPDLTHGACPDCYRKALQEVN